MRAIEWDGDMFIDGEQVATGVERLWSGKWEARPVGMTCVVASGATWDELVAAVLRALGREDGTRASVSSEGSQ